MVNNVVLVGRITRQPELRKTHTGKSVVGFTLAVNRKRNKEQADFISCVAWEHTADFLYNYISKGSLLSVEGSIQTRTYQNNQGITVYVTEVYASNVQALESRSQRTQRTPSEQDETQLQEYESFKQADEIEFDEDSPY